MKTINLMLLTLILAPLSSFSMVDSLDLAANLEQAIAIDEQRYAHDPDNLALIDGLKAMVSDFKANDPEAKKCMKEVWKNAKKILITAQKSTQHIETPELKTKKLLSKSADFF